ncbi:MerC domain-containing protein [Myxococcus sp. AM009]|uniref:MerC domain-containing protein n=1 Tax=unclassified Myxococcus TaxID=2648731 RepID=UPI001595EE37|nr:MULTISPECIES: MerC domain-containing protein [unclassified Myxococcus]NVI96601.1 MerC domain-containing protein [Myxococcus sp. AM009]
MRSSSSSVPDAACDCAHHRGQAATDPTEPVKVPGGRWSMLVPLLACALCPTCLAAYAQVLSFLGVGLSLTESAHQVMLVVAVTVSLAVSGWRSRRLRRVGPLLVTAAGCSLLVLGHALEEDPVLTWSGVVVLLAGGLWERRVWRQLFTRGSASERPAVQP